MLLSIVTPCYADETAASDEPSSDVVITLTYSEVESSENSEASAASDASESTPEGEPETTDFCEATEIPYSGEETSEDESPDPAADIDDSKDSGVIDEISDFEDNDETEKNTDANAASDKDAQMHTLGTGTYVYEIGDGSENLMDVELSKISVTDLDDGYSVLSFQFKKTGTDTSYEAVITGLKTTYADKFKDLNNSDAVNSMKLLGYYFLAESGAENLSCETQIVKEFPATDGAHNLIDAEKKQNTGNVADADSELCWAATASNMLWLTGWAQQTVNPKTNETFKSEDEVFAYFIEYFADDGSAIKYGLKWFFNGISMDQIVENGSVVYKGDKSLVDDNYMSQLIKNDGNSTGLINDVAAENVYIEYSKDNDLNIASMLDTVSEVLKEGYGIGFSFGDYKSVNGQDLRKGGHAVTMMGYIKELGENIGNAIRGIFIADSDNSKITGENSGDLSESKELRPNMYSLYLTDTKTLTNGITGYALKGYSSSQNFVLDGFTILAPSSVKESVTETSENATKTAQTTVDFVPVKMTFTCDAASDRGLEVGDVISISTLTKNMSYASIDEALDPRLSYAYDVYKDGVLYKTLTGTMRLIDLAPLEEFNIKTDYTFAEAGSYTFVLRITDFQKLDPDDNKYYSYKEAFMSNNATRQTALRLTKSSKSAGIGDISVDVKDTPSIVTASFNTNSKIESLKVSFNTAKRLFSPDGFSGLYNRTSGEYVDTADYSIKHVEDDEFELILSTDYLRTLAPGSNIFELYTNLGDGLVIVFDITIF